MSEPYGEGQPLLFVTRLPQDQFKSFCERRVRLFFSENERALIDRIECDPALKEFLRSRTIKKCLLIEIPQLEEFQRFPLGVQRALEKTIEFRVALSKYMHNLYQTPRGSPQMSKTRRTTNLASQPQSGGNHPSAFSFDKHIG